MTTPTNTAAPAIPTAFTDCHSHGFGNECLGELEYEATTSAIVMAGLFLSFLVEFLGKRVVMAKAAADPTSVSLLSVETVTVLVLECGIIFHSILIGITLVVAGDTFFLALFVGILFHQMFEPYQIGRASRRKRADLLDTDSQDPLKTPSFSLARKLLLATPFALVTPIGMAIGIGVLSNFNGNDRDTIMAIRTLDALFAGILVWVGVVEMWVEDWLHGHGELLRTSRTVTFLAGSGLVAGMVIMSVLGKLGLNYSGIPTLIGPGGNYM